MPAVRIPDPAFLKKLEALRFTVRQFRWGSRLGGRFVISRRGSSIEFADFLPYSPGDDIRAIDWKLYARLDRLFVKTYKEEVELTVEIMIDATASMGLPSPDKFTRACELALCLSAVAFAGRHHVRLSWITGETPRATPWFYRRGELARAAEALQPLQSGGASTMSRWMEQAVPALRVRGGQAVVISDWMCPPADAFSALQALRQRHVEVKVLQVLSPQELDPARLFHGGRLVDSETGGQHELAYSAKELAQAVIDHNEHLARYCKRHGMPFAQHRLNEPLEPFVLQQLPRRGFLE